MRKWVVAGTIVLLAVLGVERAGALDFSQFNPGRIIDDFVFYNANAMTADDIQRFLESKVPKCDTGNAKYGYMWAVAPCLRDYRESAKSRAADAYCKEFVGGENMRAADIIYGVAQACGINPQVIIVILQKEQALVTDVWPRDGWLTGGGGGAGYQYRSAMGYGCPDTAACDSEYYGFANQVYYGARQYKKYQALPGNYTYRAGKTNNIKWSTNAWCGTSAVYIENQATAGLYNYTPYRPNGAALAAGFGTGDGCSQYGNRNFWGYFTSWFGSTLTTLANDVWLPDGNYALTSALGEGGKSLDISGEDGNAYLWEGNGTEAQIYYVSHSPEGFYTIKNVRSGNYLEVEDNGMRNGDNVETTEGGDMCGAKWALVRSGEGYYNLLSACSGKAMDVEKEMTVDGTNIQLWEQNGSEAQRWKVVSMDAGALDDGVYTMGVETGKVLDVPGGSMENGVGLHIYANNNTGAQKWAIKRGEDGLYYIKNPASNKGLDVVAAAKANATRVQIWGENSSCAQKWAILRDGEHYDVFSACSGKALDVAAGVIDRDGAGVQIYSANETAAQRWAFTGTEDATLVVGTYSIASALSEPKVVDVAAGGVWDGTNVQLYDANGTAAQFFDVERASDGYYTLKNVRSGKYLDVAAAGLTSGTNVHVWGGNGSCAQKWKIAAEMGGKQYSLASACSGLMLDVAGGWLSNGTNIQIYASNGTLAQRWVFIEKID